MLTLAVAVVKFSLPPMVELKFHLQGRVTSPQITRSNPPTRVSAAIGKDGHSIEIALLIPPYQA